MKQSQIGSVVESLLNTASGFLISLVAQALFLPAIGVPISLHQNVAFAIFMTAVSFARGYGWRRIMEYFRVTPIFSPGLLAIAAERTRQIDAKGYSAEHDDKYAAGILARAGAAEALGDHVETIEIKAGDVVIGRVTFRTAQLYPWKGGLPVRDFRARMATAGAFMAAEIERYDRERQRVAA
jgi:hypothetical protein